MANFKLDRHDAEKSIADLQAGLDKLTFEDNFSGMMWEGTIAAGVEVAIKHRLGRIPRGFLLLMAEGTNQILKGTTEWTLTTIYFQNVATSSTFSGRILILI